MKSRREKYQITVFCLVLFLLIFLGICLMCSPWIKDAMIKKTSKSYEVSNYSVEQLMENIAAAEYIPEEDELGIPDVATVIRYLDDVDGQNVIGGIYIPDVGIHLPVLNGATKANLLAGAATIKENQVMGQGNYCLAGHHMRDDSVLFGPLTDIKEGSLIYLTDKSYLYTYRTVSVQTIHQTYMEVLDDGESPEITLITCNISGINTDYRIVVKGELIGINELDQVTDSAETDDTLMGQQEEWMAQYAGLEEYVGNYQNYLEEVEQQGEWTLEKWILLCAALSLVITCLCGYLLRKQRTDQS